MRYWCATLGLALLAGCSSGQNVEGNAQERAIANSVVLDNSGKPHATPTPGATPRHVAPAFPAAFVGRWGINEADCDPSNSANKGLLIVSKEGLQFYEARAKLTGIADTSRYAVTADLAFEGEGQKWTARQSLALASGGTALLRTEQSPVKTYRYGRC